MGHTSTVKEVIEQMRNYCSGISMNSTLLVTTFVQYMNNEEGYRNEWADYLEEKGLSLLSKGGENIYYFFMTFLLYATLKENIYIMLLKHCIADNALTKENKYFLYYQLNRFDFLNPNVKNAEIDGLKDDLYQYIYSLYKKEFEGQMHWIPESERNSEFVVVTISQMLSEAHAPTRVLLDHCYVLERYLNKKVYIINTAEFMTAYGNFPIFNGQTANYIDQYDSKGYITYKGQNFGFLQCPREMPAVPVVAEILEAIKSEKPYFILSIGGNSIVNDICSNVVPTLTIATVPSGRTMTLGQFRTIGRKITDDDRNWLAKHHMSEDAIIESVLTVPVGEQSHQYTRGQFELPEGRFIAVIVGARLDEEIDMECFRFLERLTEAGIFIVFIGLFDKYDDFAQKSQVFNENSCHLKYQDDLMAVYDLCDLYINPKRIGGGTSALEALYKGIPVVALDYGDTGVAVGADFHLKDYEDMYQQALRYAADKEFYKTMSDKARLRGRYLTDTNIQFSKVIETMKKSSRFK